MSEMGEIVELFRKQMEVQQQQIEEQRKQIEKLLSFLDPVSATPPAVASSVPSFPAFDPTSELWKEYWARFKTFAGANSIPAEKLAQVFLTNQTTTTFKLLSTLAVQQSPPKDINELSMENIAEFMENQYDPRRFVVRERGSSFGPTCSAATCDFASIKDPQDEALRTRFICSISNEAVLKALFKIKDDDLSFNRAVQIAVETEDAAHVAKETVYGTKTKMVFKTDEERLTNVSKSKRDQRSRGSKTGSTQKCWRCGNTNHRVVECRFKNAKCNFCGTLAILQRHA
uniref:CCHC-type domain-containing protein n=1 Tax=Trichuris muris TaxID=70415 RepID=A0A5S6Q6N2_TRIMR